MQTDALTPDDRFSPDEAVFDRYLAGECSVAERLALEAWLCEHPDHAARLGVVAYAAAYPVPDMRRTSPATAFKTFRNELSGNPVHDSTPGSRAPRTRPYTLGRTLRQGIWYALAGATLAVVTVVAGWHIGPRRGHRTNQAVTAYVTGKGERADITLPDGSTVVLNVASRLEVPADYLTGDRTLRLHGEALFTVQHHSDTPLTIVSEGATTRVLGTSFIVRQYATDTVTTVAVRDGRVAVGPAVVAANQLVEVRRGTIVAHGAATPAHFSFATGTLTLDGLRLPEAIAELDRWYDADIRVGDPALASQGIGGKFAAGSLADLAGNLELALNVRVVREGRVLTLYPR